MGKIVKKVFGAVGKVVGKLTGAAGMSDNMAEQNREQQKAQEAAQAAQLESQNAQARAAAEQAEQMRVLQANQAADLGVATQTPTVVTGAETTSENDPLKRRRARGTGSLSQTLGINS